MTINPKNKDPGEVAAQAEQKKQAARAPREPHVQDAPKAKPTESGKPVWDKPHSS